MSARFTTPLITQGTGPAEYAHGLLKVPELLVGVLVCVTDDPTTGRQVGDEIQCSCFTQDGTSIPDSLSSSAAMFGANATHVFVNTDWFNTLTQPDLNTVGGVPTAAKYALKVYAIAL